MEKEKEEKKEEEKGGISFEFFCALGKRKHLYLAKKNLSYFGGT